MDSPCKRLVLHTVHVSLCVFICSKKCVYNKREQKGILNAYAKCHLQFFLGMKQIDKTIEIECFLAWTKNNVTKPPQHVSTNA